MVKTILGLEGVFDATEHIHADSIISRQAALDEASKQELEVRLASAHEDRERAFHALAETASEIAPIVALLRPLAKQDFRVYSDVATA
jgi:hypothetical protein